MKLFYTPGACSLASHIVLRETGLPFDLVRVDLATGKTETGADFRAINPKGYVPALLLDDGQLLTENQVVLQYVADQAPGSHLAPEFGSLARYRLMEWLAFISTELHKGFGPLWNRQLPEVVYQLARERLANRFDYMERAVLGNDWLEGTHFSIADAYLFTVLGWGQYVGLDIGKWPALKEYHGRIFMRPSVQAALMAEGLIPSA
jgi:glutathione S-transferase